MPVRIIEVRDRGGVDRFIDFPWRIYPGRYPQWVPPLRLERRDFLNPKKNPFFDHAEVKLFLAEDGGGCLGRIAAIVNARHNATHGDKVGFFGLFESVPDPAVAAALFDAAAAFLRSRGLEVMRGPMSLSINDEAGLLVSGFERPPTVMMPYNPPYYEELVTGAGFSKAMDLLAYFTRTTPEVPERLARAARVMSQRYGFLVRKMRIRDFDAEVRRVQAIYTAAWADNWGAVAMTDREFLHLARNLKEVIDPDLCYLAEIEGQPVGFSLGLPDVNQALRHMNGRLLPFGILKFLWHRRSISGIRVITMGVLKPYRHMGIDAAFYAESYRNAYAKRLLDAEASWILENNTPMRRALERMGFVVSKTYRVYDRPLA